MPRKDPASVTEAEKQKELRTIKRAINQGYASIEADVREAGKLLRHAVRLVKRVGNLLAA